MIEINESVDVAAGPAAAFAVVTRLESYPAWLPGVRRAEPMEAAPGSTDLRAGSGFRLVSSGPGGLEVIALGRVQALDPPHSITIDASSSFFELTATCIVEPLDADRSRISVRATVQPRGLASLAAGRIEQDLRAAVPGSLARLREAMEAVEAGGPGVGDPR